MLWMEKSCTQLGWMKPYEHYSKTHINRCRIFVHPQWGYPEVTHLHQYTISCRFGTAKGIFSASKVLESCSHLMGVQPLQRDPLGADMQRCAASSSKEGVEVRAACHTGRLQWPARHTFCTCTSAHVWPSLHEPTYD